MCSDSFFDVVCWKLTVTRLFDHEKMIEVAIDDETLVERLEEVNDFFKL
jgi:hypothetical protein